MSTNIKITIAESSSIIRCGLETLLKRLPGFRIQISEITAADCLTEGLRIYKPDILIVNPSIPGNFNLQHLKDECGCPGRNKSRHQRSLRYFTESLTHQPVRQL